MRTNVVVARLCVVLGATVAPPARRQERALGTERDWFAQQKMVAGAYIRRGDEVAVRTVAGW